MENTLTTSPEARRISEKISQQRGVKSTQIIPRCHPKGIEMSEDESLDDILKKMWEISNKRAINKPLSIMELLYYHRNLKIIRDYYYAAYSHWENKFQEVQKNTKVTS